MQQYHCATSYEDTILSVMIKENNSICSDYVSSECTHPDKQL